MATLAELLKDIKELLRSLSDRFDELAGSISELEARELAGDSDTSAYSMSEVGETFDALDDTQSLEPPPPDGPIEEEAEDPDEPKTSEMKAVSGEEAATGRIGRKERETETLAPPGEKAGALPVLEKLARLQEIVEKKKLEVSPKDFSFIPKSTEVYKSLSDTDRVGSKGARIILDCINFLDTIAYKYVGDYYSALQKAVEALTASLSDFLQSEVGYRVFPLREKSRQEIEELVSDYAESVQEKQGYSSEPVGTILAVRRRGAVLGGDVVRKAQILTSSGQQSETDDILRAGLDAVSALKANTERAADMKLKAVSSLIEWREKLYGSSEDHALTIARYALNLLYTLENPVGASAAEMFPDRGQKLRKINDRIVSLLRSNGLSEILVSVGGAFDESYDPSKYERKKVSSDKPDGTIVGVLRKGFLDRNGIPVQKAVIAVSGK
jgi:molecular chaperone GrpE (heat shock protein)